MKLTPIFVIILGVLITVFDFFIIAKDGRGESISAYFIRWGHEFPLIPFLLGMVCGHLFWRMPDKNIEEKKE